MDEKMKQFAMNMLQKSQAMNTPMGQQFLQILQSNDMKAGEQMANNICNTYGVSREQAIQQARNHFHI